VETEDPGHIEPPGPGNVGGEEPAQTPGYAQPQPPQPEPPQAAGYAQPAAPLQYYQAPIAPPVAKPSHTVRTLLIIALIVGLILGALGGGAFFASASLSSTYSPERAVTDYLAAQKKGDTRFMIANANYLRGDGSFSQYFDRNGLAAMMAFPQNSDISNVKVATATEVDSNTRSVGVSMTWAGHQVTRSFTVHKDLTRVHFSFYYSWLVDIPSASIHLKLPNQPGEVAVDGIPVPADATSDIQVIQGFHKVTVAANGLYDAASADADGIDTAPNVILAGNISSTATTSAAAAVKKAFGTCTATDHQVGTQCLKHLYHAPTQPGFIYYFDLPGYGQVDYTTYEWALTSDPTKGMKLVVEPDPGKVTAGGACAFTMTIDGSKTYRFKGTWSGTLTQAGATFGYDLLFDCLKSKA
jgi:archaellum component FlaF (FlaF/FlaG flagellin family)